MKKTKNIFYKTLQLFCVPLFCIFIVGSCSSKPAPVQVHGALKFGPYTISPPVGYWYFPRKYPRSFKLPFKTSKDFFLVTFFENKDVISHKTRSGVFMNFGVYKNIYKSFDAYYRDAAEKNGSLFRYEELPKEAQVLKNIPSWNCKQTNWGAYGLQCLTLDKHIVIIGIFGDKNQVLSKIPELKRMVDSVKYIESR
jgi:hypothetical protein